ncbi:hypothetical protein D9M68_764760 [compost metagenome]
MRAAGEPVRREIGLAAELDDALGDLVGVALLFIGVGQEFFGHALRVRPLRHEVVAAIAQHADDFRGQRVVEQLQHRLAVRRIARGHGTLVDVLAGALAQGLDVGEERLVGHGLAPVGDGCMAAQRFIRKLNPFATRKVCHSGVRRHHAGAGVLPAP